MKFKQFYQVTRKIDFERINKSMLENLQDIAFHAKNKTGIDERLLMSTEELSKTDFFNQFPHLA